MRVVGVVFRSETKKLEENGIFQITTRLKLNRKKVLQVLQQ